MTNSDKISILEGRHRKLKRNGKNVDSPGVVKKLERKILKLKQS